MWYVEFEKDYHGNGTGASITWYIKKINMYEFPAKNICMKFSGTYHECFMFIYKNIYIEYKHLQKPKDIGLYCSEWSYTIKKKELVDTLMTIYPEKFI